MAQDGLKMAIFDPLFGRREPPMAPFDEPSGEKLAYGMTIHMRKQWWDFETICRRNNFSGGLLLLLVACLLSH